MHRAGTLEALELGEGEDDGLRLGEGDGLWACDAVAGGAEVGCPAGWEGDDPANARKPVKMPAISTSTTVPAPTVFRTIRR